MGDRTIAQALDFTRYPPDEIRLLVCEWLRHHGIDPCDVAVPGRIERWIDKRQVRYLAYDLDEHGRITMNAARTEVQYVQRVVQLEAVPSPFPELLA